MCYTFKITQNIWKKIGIYFIFVFDVIVGILAKLWGFTCRNRSGCDVDWPVAVYSDWWYPDQLDSFEWKHPTGTCDTCNATNISSVMESQNHWNICLKHIELRVYPTNKCKLLMNSTKTLEV